MNKSIVSLMLITLGLELSANSIILNEYNAVAPDLQLKNNGYDTHFGDINGNGGDWIEIVITEDFLDLRGATLNMERSKGVPLFNGKFPSLTELAFLRKGTIITISNEPTDLSYNPLGSSSDWTININIDDLEDKSGTFDVSDNTMDIWIESVDKEILMPHSGEIVKGWGIDDEEVFKLKKDPSADIEPDDTAYGDDYSGKQIISTFGEPNQWIDSSDQHHTQDFTTLRTINSNENKMLLLNEYDAVVYYKYLKNNGYDTYFGKEYGNGNYWIEFVVLKSHLDLRGAKLEIDPGCGDPFKAKLPKLPELADLASGTIITISNKVPTDTSYNPFDSCKADWTININTDDLEVTSDNRFYIGDNNLKLSLKSGSGDIVILPESGEGIAGGNVDDEEVFKLKKDPSIDVTPTDSSYGDDNNGQAISTFGSANLWRDNSGNMVEQNLTKLRVSFLEKYHNTLNSQLILNEYNAVSSDKYLKDGGSDSYFGTVAGNGNSWFELVVKNDYLNLQNAKIKIEENCVEKFTGKIPELLSLAYLRKGTIITVSNEPTDMSYHPFTPNSDDWKLNININDLTEKSGTFKLGDNNISISIVDESGTKTLLAPSGERIWKSVTDDQEVYKLSGEPTKDTTPFNINYGDDKDKKAISTFGSANKWEVDGVIKSQNLSIRENQDLIEIGGIALSNIAGFEELRDAESILYIAQNNSLWITDDDSHNLFEMDYTTKNVKRVISDDELGNFAPDVGSCESVNGEYVGACDIESIAYDEQNDTLYILTGKAPGTPAIFKLTRDSQDEQFELSEYKHLGDIEYPAAIFIDNQFIVAQNKSLYKYSFESNGVDPDILYTTPTGRIVGLAYDGTYLWVTTSNFELMKVDWATKETLSIYPMGENGVYDPRGVEIIDNKLHILEGINSSGNEIIAPVGHVLKNAIHIYQKP